MVDVTRLEKVIHVRFQWEAYTRKLVTIVPKKKLL